MILIAGLGNIGEKYDNTRHNIGFAVVDSIVTHYHDYIVKKRDFSSETWQGCLPNIGTAIIIKPKTYMNLSGASVSACVKYFKINTRNVFVIHDDLDIKLGKIQIKNGGSHRGHNGLKSIESMIGRDYNKISIGINRPEIKDKEIVSSYVMDKFMLEELSIINAIKLHITEHLDMILTSENQNWKHVVNSVLLHNI